MSKKNVLDFFSHAAKDEELKAKITETSSQEELTTIGQEAGYSFSTEHIAEALQDLRNKPGLLGSLADAVFELFAPVHDNYPATGVQPFSGDPNPTK